MSAGSVLAIVMLLVANAFFVAVEFALVASRPTKLQAMAERGNAAAARALASTRDLSVQLAGAQLGITIASLLLGYVGEPAIAHAIEAALHDVVEIPEAILEGIGFGIALIIVVFLHMVLGEMVPKNIAIAGPERTLLALDLPNRLYLALFRPFIAALNGMANLVLRLLHRQPADEVLHHHSAEELADIVAESRDEGLIAELEDRLLRAALAIGDSPVSQVMVPLDRIGVVARSVTPEEAEQAVLSTGHSRLLVVGDGLDDVLGFVHAKDLLRIPGAQRDRPLPLGRIRRTPIVGTETVLDDALVALQRARVHLAVVADAAGHTVGLVTLEDILEVLVGDILDESDRRPTRGDRRRSVS